MALIKCTECGKKISTKAAACPECGAPVKSKSKSLAVSTGCGCLIIALATIGLICGLTGGFPRNPGPTNQPIAQPPEKSKTISYEVLRNEKRRGNGKLVLEVLVSEPASKQDILKLAESLRREHDGKFAHISIFDSQEAWRRRKDESYSEKELSRHWLVVVAGDFGQEIRWVGEGRDH